MKALELRIPPLLLLLVFAGAMLLVERFFPGHFALPPRLPLALLLALAGALIVAAGVLAFRRRQTTLNPMQPAQASALVASGIYAYSRNPIYLGFLLILLGWGIFLAHALAALLLSLFVLYMNRFQIGPEERALEAKFGADFAAYCRSVRRWL